MLLRARHLVPVSRPPIENGAVLVQGDQIAAVGRWPELRGDNVPVVDLGDQILLPGLINAHCHLDYTGLAGRLTPPKVFPDWIKSLLTLKAGLGYTEYAHAWLTGARMLVESGTTTVADMEAVPELLPEVWTATPLRVMSFLEMTGVRSRRPPESILAEVCDLLDRLDLSGGQTGLSPHAPYSTTPALLKRCAEWSRMSGRRVAIHVAESEPEYQMFMYRRGAMHDWLRGQRDFSDCGHGSPVQHVQAAGLLSPRTLLVHVNYLWDPDAQIIAGSRSHVVHCPRSHRFFGHRRFPRRELAAAGVNVCLGTDSLASVLPGRGAPLTLDMFEEMRTLAAGSSDLAPAEILRMATVNGAAALGLGGRAGEIAPGTPADLIAVPCTEPQETAEQNILQHRGQVAASMIGGRWVIPPGDQPVAAIEAEMAESR